MSARYQTLRGTRDILPDEAARWRFVERTARERFSRYGYGEIRTPVLESTELFARSVGEDTDIVRKEMYTFERGSESVTLRPENTASVVRAFLQHALHREVASGYPVKLYYVGPMFRYERPQAGRQRQFHQIGVEVLGAPEPAADAECLRMLDRFLGALGIEDRKLLLNTLGDPAERDAYRERLRDWAGPRIDRDDADLVRMWTENPLRLLDSKLDKAREAMEGAPTLLDGLSGPSREHFDAVCASLDGCDVAYALEPRLVRGLDYYRRTVFEVTSGGLGAQNAILGGGRYDGLVEDLGGPALPGFGFAIGLERLVSLVPAERIPQERPEVAVVVLGGALAGAFPLVESLRDAGVRVLAPLSERPMGAQMKRASKAGARFALFVGPDELERGTFGFKDLARGEQVDAPPEAVVESVAAARAENAAENAEEIDG